MRKLALTLGALALAAASIAYWHKDARQRHHLDSQLSADLGGATSRDLSHEKAFSFPAANMAKEKERAFFFGNRLFNTNWIIAPGSTAKFDGLGPLYNRVSCSGCHTRDGRGQPPADGQGPLDSLLLRLSLPGQTQTGGPLPHPLYGTQLSERAIPGVPPEGRVVITYQEIPGHYQDGTPFSLRQPSYEIVNLAYGELGPDILLSPRVAPAVIGLGLLQALEEKTLEALADPNDADGDGISGRVNLVWSKALGKTAIGRFGWKANTATLLDQNADAALGDIGLTSPLHETENCAQDQRACQESATGEKTDLDQSFLERLTIYTHLLAVPSQRDFSDQEVKAGEALFAEIGCAGCHLPTLVSGELADFPELSNQTFHPFTDLLLHDMGEGLADGRPDFEADGKEWRTAPLWGLGLIETVNGHLFLLHDARARGIEEAILWHGGEAEAAKEAFRGLPEEDRQALISFLKSL